MKSTLAIVAGVALGLLAAFVLLAFAAGIWWAMTLTRSLDDAANPATWFAGGFIGIGAFLSGWFTAWRDPAHPFRSAAIAGVVIALAQTVVTPYLPRWQLLLLFLVTYGLIPLSCALIGAAGQQWLRTRTTAT